ncbi:MAG: phage holin [Clostridia bacterium]
MKINWKARLRSGPFWLGLISAVVAAVCTIIPLCGVDLSVTAEQIMHAATLVLMIPTALGVISDPTTKGICDSQMALTYDKPRCDNEEK